LGRVKSPIEAGRPGHTSTWTQQIYSFYGIQPEAMGGTSSQQGYGTSGTSGSEPTR
jgi:hypothetical protein